MFVSCSHRILVQMFLEVWASMPSFRDPGFFHLEALPFCGCLESSPPAGPGEGEEVPLGCAWKWPPSLLPIFSWLGRSHMVPLPTRGARSRSLATSPRGTENSFWRAHSRVRLLGQDCLPDGMTPGTCQGECQQAAFLGAHEDAIRQ